MSRAPDRLNRRELERLLDGDPDTSGPLSELLADAAAAEPGRVDATAALAAFDRSGAPSDATAHRRPERIRLRRRAFALKSTAAGVALAAGVSGAALAASSGHLSLPTTGSGQRAQADLGAASATHTAVTQSVRRSSTPPGSSSGPSPRSDTAARSTERTRPPVGPDPRGSRPRGSGARPTVTPGGTGRPGGPVIVPTSAGVVPTSFTSPWPTTTPTAPAATGSGPAPTPGRGRLIADCVSYFTRLKSDAGAAGEARFSDLAQAAGGTGAVNGYCTDLLNAAGRPIPTSSPTPTPTRTRPGHSHTPKPTPTPSESTIAPDPASPTASTSAPHGHGSPTPSASGPTPSASGPAPTSPATPTIPSRTRPVRH